MSHVLLSPRRKTEDSYVDPPELDTGEEKENGKRVVAEVVKPIFNPPLPKALIPLLYHEKMRVYICLTDLKAYSTITQVEEHTLDTMERKDIPFSNVAPAIPIAGGEEVFIFPPEGTEYFGRMVSMPNLQQLFISFQGKEIAISRTRIWPIATINPDAYKKRLMEAVNGIKG
jgi:hypothetical protein